VSPAPAAAASTSFYPVYFLVDSSGSLPDQERVWDSLDQAVLKAAEGDAANTELLILDRDNVGAPVAKAGDKKKKSAAAAPKAICE